MAVQRPVKASPVAPDVAEKLEAIARAPRGITGNRCRAITGNRCREKTQDQRLPPTPRAPRAALALLARVRAAAAGP